MITVDRVPGGSYSSLVTTALLVLVALINIALFLFVMLRKPRVVADA